MVIGTDILLDKGERLFTYKTKISGEIYYSTSKYKNNFIDGTEFLTVFTKPRTPKERRTMMIRADALERIRL